MNSTEEQLVRQTYAKLSFETEIDAVHQLARQKPLDPLQTSQRLEADTLRFTISDFHIGDLRDVANRPYSDLVDCRKYTLSFGGKSLDYKNESQVLLDTYASVGGDWQDQTSDPAPQEWSLPMDQAVKLIAAQNSARFDRYASYTVTARFHGQSHAYRAMSLFGSDLQSQPTVLFADNTVGTSALMEARRSNPYPHTLLETVFRNNSAVQAWLHGTLRSQACAQGTVCCDENACSLPATKAETLRPATP
jgi:hypothetical protein